MHSQLLFGCEAMVSPFKAVARGQPGIPGTENNVHGALLVPQVWLHQHFASVCVLGADVHLGLPGGGGVADSSIGCLPVIQPTTPLATSCVDTSQQSVAWSYAARF